MGALEIVFVGCFFLGLAYAVISAIFGGILGGGHEGGGEGGGDFDAGHDIAGHIDTGNADSGAVHFSPLSPVILAMFVTSFGAAGMICLKMFNLSPYASLPIAVGAGLVIASITFFIFVTIFKSTQGSSESTMASLVGQEAEVITSIPAEGLGEIAYNAKGSRYTAPARASQRIEIKSHSVVTIEKIVSNTCYVKPSEGTKVL